MSPTSSDPRTLIPHWRPGDEQALQERVRRLHEPRTPIARTAREIQPAAPLRCQKGCDEGQHGHGARLVGQFWLCLCLSCPVLVLNP